MFRVTVEGLRFRVSFWLGLGIGLGLVLGLGFRGYGLGVKG